MSELLKRSIDLLTVIVNVSTGLAHPLDESRAKELFLALHGEGEELDFEMVKEVAIKCGWSDRHASNLAALAEKIGHGRSVVIKHPRDWGEPAVGRLKLEIAQEIARL